MVPYPGEEWRYSQPDPRAVLPGSKQLLGTSWLQMTIVPDHHSSRCSNYPTIQRCIIHTLSSATTHAILQCPRRTLPARNLVKSPIFPKHTLSSLHVSLAKIASSPALSSRALIGVLPCGSDLTFNAVSSSGANADVDGREIAGGWSGGLVRFVQAL